MQAIPHLVLRTPKTVAPLNRATFSGVMSRLATGIVGHCRPIAGLLGPRCVVVIVLLRRPLVQALKVEVFPLIPLFLIPALLIVIVILLFHRPFYDHHGII